MKKLRRIWANLFRPVNKISFLEPISLITLVTFILSVVLYLIDVEWFYVPFLISWSFIIISVVYFNKFPLTWDEMNDKEKEAYKKFNG